LNTFEPVLTDHINAHNSKPTKQIPLHQSFVAKGALPDKTKQKPERTTLLDGATDWKILVDYNNKPIVFPPTAQRDSARIL
jgi:hypothetical protein